MSVKEKVTNAISTTVSNLGYEIVEVAYKKEYDGMVLTIFIDNDKGISLNDCEIVSLAIDPILDELNPTKDKPYALNVSSPGIDRPLKTDRDYQKNLDKEITITLYKAIQDKKRFEGTLLSFDADSVTLDNDGIIKFLRKDIAVARPVIKF